MVTGVVDQVFVKPYNGKTLYSVKLVNDQSYGSGTFNPNVTPGDRVEFQAIQKGNYFNLDKNTFKNLGPSQQESVSRAVPAKNFLVGKDDYWSGKEKRDLENDKLRSLGAARNTAIDWIKFLVEKEALPVAKKANEREETLNKLLDDYTLKFMSGIIPTVEEVVEEEQTTPKTRAQKAPASVVPSIEDAAGAWE